MSAPLALAIVLAIVIPVQLFRAYRMDDGLVERWARGAGLPLTPENRPLVARYLRNARVLRTWGAVAGVVVPSLGSLVASGRVVVLGFGTDGESAPLAFGTIFVGYLIGALVAELTLGRPMGGTRRAASLVRRELGDYLSPRILLAQRAASAAGALGVLAVAAVPYDRSISNPGTASLILVAAGVLGFGAGLEAIERWLVRRPQPYTSPSVVAADDAIRAQSIQALAEAGLSLLLLLCSGLCLALAASDVTVLRSTMYIPAAACLIASLLVSRGIGDGPRRVRDTRPMAAA
jgi:hypothetical protein